LGVSHFAQWMILHNCYSLSFLQALFPQFASSLSLNISHFAQRFEAKIHKLKQEEKG
jgi:hypothetical protein